MTNVFTLDSLRDETVKRYEPVVLELGDGTSITLKSTLRLGKRDREAVLAAIKEIESIEEDFDDDDEEMIDTYSELVCASIEKIFRLISSKPKRLLVELDNEDPRIKVSLYTAVLRRWMGGTQLGEAEPSLS